jgi:hypothetical protein
MYVSQADSVTVADPVQDDRPGYIVRGPYTLTVVRSFSRLARIRPSG